MTVSACAKASASEEPNAGILHVRVCAGGAGQPASLPRRSPTILLIARTSMIKSIKEIFTSRHPDCEQPLPQHGILYFDLLDAELRSKPSQPIEQELGAVIDSIRNKRRDRSLTWNDLYTFDLILSRFLPPESLSREVWSLRSRYRDVTGLREYEAYLASKPPDLGGQVEEKDLRADIEYLLSQIYLRYAITPINQEVSDHISRRVTVVILAGVAIIVLAVLLNVTGIIRETPPATLLPVLFVGAMGGLLSMQQRYQSVSREGDPIDNISQLMQNWSRLFLPAISGAIFAALLYMLFIGGLLEGDLFPKLGSNPGNTNNQDGTSMWDFLKHARPGSSRDYAKLIIWSFIAGFAERFVPDTLSRFISRREADTKNVA